MSIQWKIKNFPVLKSTQETLKTYLSDNPNTIEGMVVCAQSQTGGHGRHGRVWSSGEGNLCFSYYLRPSIPCDKIGQLALLSGVCIVRVVRKYLSSTYAPILKWPNDVLIEGGKCSGVLIEVNTVKDGVVEDVFVGVGMNIKTVPIDEASALCQFSDMDLDCSEFLNAYLETFSDLYNEWQRDGFEDIRQEWLRHTYDVGTLVSVKIGTMKISGAFDGIDNHGNLILICDDSGQRRVVSSGDVFMNPKEN